MFDLIEIRTVVESLNPQDTLSDWWSAAYQRKQFPKGDRQYLKPCSREGSFFLQVALESPEVAKNAWSLEQGRLVLFIDLPHLFGVYKSSYDVAQGVTWGQLGSRPGKRAGANFDSWQSVLGLVMSVLQRAEDLMIALPARKGTGCRELLGLRDLGLKIAEQESLEPQIQFESHLPVLFSSHS